MKQGGVLSPILFGVYNNSLLDKLDKSRAGCYIGQIFMEAFGYADDIILLAPCKKSLCVLLNICKQFSLEFQVNFNLSKSKLIVFSNANDFDTSVLFNNQMISILVILLATRYHKNALRASLMILSKEFCMSFYRSVLWDFSSKHGEMFYTTWRNVSDAYWVFHIELIIICFTSFVTIYRSTDNYIYVF